MFQSVHFFLNDFLLFFSHRIRLYKEWCFIFKLKVNFYEWTCTYLISKTENIMKIIYFLRKSSLPLSSSNESSRFNLSLSISASVMCLLLSSGSSQGYLSSFVGTFVSSLIMLVHADILGISDE